MIRFLDILFSLVALILLSPLLLPILLILKFTGEHEVFFCQQRVGKNGHPFALIKFATMLKNSPNVGTGTVTLKNDPRVLPAGRFLRKTKLNELPQLLNILKGDMSIIGPRPQTQRCFEAFPTSSQNMIKQVRPGLSGMGSIVFRAEEDLMDDAENADMLYDEVIMPYKGLLESWYVEHKNLYVYIMLIILTAWAVVFPNSVLVWKVFASLPPVPNELKEKI